MRAGTRSTSSTVADRFAVGLGARNETQRATRDGDAFFAPATPSPIQHRVENAQLETSLIVEVALPDEYDFSDRVYPVVYVIDGQWFFPTVVQTSRLLGLGGEMEPAIIVGLRYDHGSVSIAEAERRTRRLRIRYMTPSVDHSISAADLGLELRGNELLVSGEAAIFRQLLLAKVMPLIERTYRVRENGSFLFGYSLGGLFALETLLGQCEAFVGYIIASPSLWWDRAEVLQRLATWGAAPQLAGRLFLSVGMLEEPPHLAHLKMVRNFEALNAALNLHARFLRCDSLIAEGHTHGSAFLPAMGAGLPSLLPGVAASHLSTLPVPPIETGHQASPLSPPAGLLDDMNKPGD